MQNTFGARGQEWVCRVSGYAGSLPRLSTEAEEEGIGEEEMKM